MEVFVKNTMLLVCLLALCNLMLYAQTERHPRIVHTKEKSPNHIPPQKAPAGLKKIYSNLGTNTDLYDDESGWSIQGPEAVKKLSFRATGRSGDGLVEVLRVSDIARVHPVSVCV
jgi:hypothetical protein